MSVYEFGPFRLDAGQLLLFEGGEPVALGPKVVETLLALIEHPGEVLTKSALLDRNLARRLRGRSESRAKRLRAAQSPARPLGRRSDRDHSAARLSFRRSGRQRRSRARFAPVACGRRRSPSPPLGIVCRRGTRARPHRRNGLYSCNPASSRARPADRRRRPALRDRALLLEYPQPRRHRQERRLLLARRRFGSARCTRLRRARIGECDHGGLSVRHGADEGVLRASSGLRAKGVGD